MSIRAILIITGLFANNMLFTQNPDSLLTAGREVIQRQVEYYEETEDNDAGLNDLTEALEYRLEEPLNINDATSAELRKLGLLNDIQVKNLIDYRNKYGRFYSIYELKAIEGLGRMSLEKIIPFVLVGPPTEKAPPAKKLLRGRHELFLRAERKIVSRAAYHIPADSLQSEQPGSFYLGDPNRYYLRYRYRAARHFGLGLTADKDAGEMFFSPLAGITPDIRQNLGKQWGFDFYSAHIELKNIGILRSLVIGDYHTQFGQGLTLWTGTSFSGGADPSGFKKFAAMVKPNTSANENSFMRGVAIRLHRKRFDLNIFYSRKKADANLSSTEAGDKTIATSLPDAGYHRSLSEISKKNVMLQQFWGGHLSYANRRVRLGLTSYRTLFDISLLPDDIPARAFQFRGKENVNAGVNFEILLNKTMLYGEFAMSLNGGWAMLGGITHNTANGNVLALQYREYRKNYQNLMAGAYGRRSNNANERGIRLALETSLHPDLGLHIYSEHYAYPWLTTRMANPFRGIKNELLLDYTPQRHTRLTLKYRYQKSLAKSTDKLNWFDEAYHEYSHKISVRARKQVIACLSIKSQADFVIVANDRQAAKSQGSQLSMDIFYHPVRIPLKLSFRYALFNTSDYAARLYAYEHDVLYASSIPAYYGKGFRTYLLVKYEISSWFDAWLRFSLTNFTDRRIISSGPDEIKGSKVPEIKIQCRIKLSPPASARIRRMQECRSSPQH